MSVTVSFCDDKRVTKDWHPFLLTYSDSEITMVKNKH